MYIYIYFFLLIVKDYVYYLILILISNVDNIIYISIIKDKLGFINLLMDC